MLLGLVAVVVALQSKAEWAEARGERFDWIGSAIYGASIAAVMYGLSLLPDPRGGIVLTAGLAGIAGFVAWETARPRRS